MRRIEDYVFRIAMILRSLGFTTNEIAKALKVSQSTLTKRFSFVISRVERGRLDDLTRMYEILTIILYDTRNVITDEFNNLLQRVLRIDKRSKRRRRKYRRVE